MHTAHAIMATDDPQWSYLLAAISRIETRQQALADSDAQKTVAILSIKEDLHRVEQQLEDRIKTHQITMEEKLRPMEAIADKIYAGKVVAAAIFGGLLALSGILGAWSVIKGYFMP